MSQPQSEASFSTEDRLRQFHKAATIRLKEQNKEIEYLLARVEKLEIERTRLKRIATILSILLALVIWLSLTHTIQFHAALG